MPIKIPQFGGGSDVARPIRENIILMSDYADFLPGVNWEKYYYGDDDTVTTRNLILFPSAFTAGSGGTLAATAIPSTSYTKEYDKSFDLTIKGERIIGGDFLSEIKMYTAAEGGGISVSYYVIIKIIHYDGTTETTLVTVQGLEHTRTGGNGDTTDTLTGTITSKHFKIGDILRVTVELWAKESADHANNKCFLYYDGTTTYVQIPYSRLDEY